MNEYFAYRQKRKEKKHKYIMGNKDAKVRQNKYFEP